MFSLFIHFDWLELVTQTKRFHVLVGLMLSSQTKDPVTAQGIANLKKTFDGLTVDAICRVTNMERINACINKVGFHNRKTQYLFKTANILKKEYDGDIPDTVKGLCALPGVGPKMVKLDCN